MSLLHTAENDPTPEMHRILKTFKVDSDESMVEFHEEMMKGIDIITQIEISGICYVMTQQLIVEQPKPPEDIALAKEQKKKKRK